MGIEIKIGKAARNATSHKQLESCLNTGQILLKPWVPTLKRRNENKKCGKKGFLSLLPFHIIISFPSYHSPPLKTYSP